MTFPCELWPSLEREREEKKEEEEEEEEAMALEWHYRTNYAADALHYSAEEKALLSRNGQ